jgi:N4-gp56 family major capsid protein
MALSQFVPEVWSAALLTSLQKALIYAGPGVVNRDYEGEITAAGDTVRITSISRPTVGTYTPGSTTITPEQLVDAQRTLVIDQVKYWAFQVDDVNQRQVLGDVIPAATAEAAYALADVVDQYVAGLYTQASASNVVSAVTVDLTSPTSWDAEAAKAYNEILIPLKVKLDEANVPTMGRYAVLPPWLHGVLLRDPRFVKVNESGTDEGLRNGQVGRAAGFDILMSNNCPVPTANNYVVTAGNSSAITFAEQINKTEAYRPESSFSDAIKGLAMYGSRVVRPEALAYATAISS